MKIDRQILIGKLAAFAKAGHGLVVGNPGVGKSHALADLSETLWEAEIPNFILRADQTEGTDQAISDELKINIDWTQALNEIPANPTSKSIFIIDSFDSTRDDQSRKAYLGIIKKALTQLDQARWNVIVSVRTYDAEKSPQLLNLFPINPRHNLGKRIFDVPSLSDVELESAFRENQMLGNLYQSVTAELKMVLRTPFFLSLLERVMNRIENQTVNTLKVIKTETELLNTFWDVKIVRSNQAEERTIFLHELSNAMIDQRSLNVNSAQFLRDKDISLFHFLRSEDIISPVGINATRLAYSHNIFFDYIVSRVSIPETPKQITKFILDDKSRPFFLRPSFVFYLSRLWLQNRIEFWKTYRELSISTDPNIVLFHRFLLTSVIANLYEETADVEELLKHNELTQRLLQSLRFLRVELEPRDLKLIVSLSERIDARYLWDMTILVDNSVGKNKSSEQATPILIPDVGVIARNTLKFILDNRVKVDEYQRQSWDRLCSSRVVPLVCRTYASNPTDSKALLIQVLAFLSDPKFDITYFSFLTASLSPILLVDDEFVASVFRVVFGHVESSEEKTILGTGVMLTMQSNRRQDFESCYYRLIKFFPEVIRHSPRLGIQIGMAIANNYILLDKLRYLGDRVKTVDIEVHGIGTKFTSDNSYMWHDMVGYTHRPVMLIDEILNYFRDVISAERWQSLPELLDEYIRNANAGYTWRGLIQLLNSNVDYFRVYLLDLLTTKEILLSYDTTEELIQSFPKVSSEFSENELNSFVDYLLSICKENHTQSERVVKESVLRFLSHLPLERISNQEALEMLDTTSSTIQRRDEDEEETTVSNYSTEDWLEDRGIDTKDAKNKPLVSQMNLLQAFNRQWDNNTPSREDFLQQFPTFISLFNILGTEQGIAAELQFSIHCEVAKFAAVVLRNQEEVSVEEYIIFKDVILKAIAHHTKFDENTQDRSPSMGYSPTPRIEAAGGLMNLYRYSKEEDVLQSVVKYVHDDDSVVRFHILNHLSFLWRTQPQVFWKIEKELIEVERDSFNLGLLITSIFKTDIIDSNYDDVIECLIKAEKHVKGRDSQNHFIKSYITFLLYLIERRSDKRCEELIQSNISDAEFAIGVVSRIFEAIDPKFPSNDYSNSTINTRLIVIARLILTKTFESLKIHWLASPQSEETAKQIKAIDFIVQRMYFSLDFGARGRRNPDLHATIENKKAYYDRISSMFELIIDESAKVGSGIILAHTAHYLIETFNGVLDFYPMEGIKVLKWVHQVTTLTRATGYSFDTTAVSEVVSFTEKILADHAELLKTNDVALSNLVDLLTIYVESGWPEALTLLWRMDEIFK